MDQQNTHNFKDPTDLTEWAKAFLFLGIMMTAVCLISGALEYRLLRDIEQGAYTSESDLAAAASSNDLREGIIWLIWLAVYVATAVCVLRWIHRANYNAHRLGALGMRFTPGWSVGWYFVPIACLWKPYQAMKEIWMVSRDAANWRSQPVPLLLPWWWFLWIASILLAKASSRLSANAEEIDELLLANVVTLVSDVAAIPLNLVLWAIVAKVCRMQLDQYRKDGTQQDIALRSSGRFPAGCDGSTWSTSQGDH